jgi:hypothetical protein
MICALIVKRFAHFLVSSHGVSWSRVRSLGRPCPCEHAQEWRPAVIATCQACEHKSDVNVDALPETIAVPQIGRLLRCSECAGKRIDTRLAWHTR